MKNGLVTPRITEGLRGGEGGGGGGGGGGRRRRKERLTAHAD